MPITADNCATKPISKAIMSAFTNFQLIGVKRAAKAKLDEAIQVHDTAVMTVSGSNHPHKALNIIVSHTVKISNKM